MEKCSVSKPSGRQDLNLRPTAPKAAALPSCATSRNRAAGRRFVKYSMGRGVKERELNIERRLATVVKASSFDGACSAALNRCRLGSRRPGSGPVRAAKRDRFGEGSGYGTRVGASTLTSSESLST